MDYSKVTFTEYQAKKKAIMDSLGRKSGRCAGIYNCKRGPFNGQYPFCSNNVEYEMENPLETVQLIMDYEIPVNWSKVEVDTPMFVRDNLFQQEFPRYFAKYEDDTIYAFGNGCTSFTTSDIIDWKYARLAESEE